MPTKQAKLFPEPVAARLRQLITPPANVPSGWSYFFVGSTAAYLCGLVLQPIWAVMFFWLDAPIIASICIVTMLMFVAVLALNQRGLLRAAMYLTYLEVTGHAALLTYYVGWEGSFHFYIMDLLAVWCVAPMLRVSTRIVGAFLAILLVVYLHHTYSAAAPYYTLPVAWMTFFMIQSIATAHVILGLSVYYYAVVNETIFRERERLSHRLAEKRRMDGIATIAGGVAHQFNNLLAVIMGNAELIRMQTDTPKRQRQLESIRLACEKGHQLSNSLLTYSGHQKGAVHIHNLAALLQDCTNRFAIDHPDCNIDLQIHDDAAQIEGFHDQICQAVMALLANAREATVDKPADIVVSLSAMRMTAGKLRRLSNNFGLPEGSTATCLEVRDHGEGIKADIQNMMFEPFYTSRHQVGLGLSHVIGLVRMLHGGIEVESTIGKGARFAIYLPRT